MNDTVEAWKDIVGFEGHYIVSTLGRVKSLPRKLKTSGGTRTINLKGRILKRSKSGGYAYVRLTNHTTAKTFKVARLVATAFIPNPNNKRTVNHRDGYRLNDKVINLEWNTDIENVQHAIVNKLRNT